MSSTSIITIVLIISIALFAIYKRDMITKMFSLNVDASRSQFQQELEQTADTIIKRLEDQNAHLEYLLKEADVKLDLLDQKIQLAEGLIKQTINFIPTSAEGTASTIDIQVKPTIDEIATIMPLEPPHSDRRSLIIAMADQGYNVTEIAKATSLGKGEIMLLLQLHKW